jgi:hypothetical protein
MEWSAVSVFLCKVHNHFENIADTRVDRGANHSLIEMIFLTLCATLCDADGWADVERFGKAKLYWLRKFPPFELGIPSTIRWADSSLVWIRLGLGLRAADVPGADFNRCQVQ